MASSAEANDGRGRHLLTGSDRLIDTVWNGHHEAHRGAEHRRHGDIHAARPVHDALPVCDCGRCAKVSEETNYSALKLKRTCWSAPNFTFTFQSPAIVRLPFTV